MRCFFSKVQNSVCSVFSGSSFSTCSLVRRSINGRSPFASASQSVCVRLNSVGREPLYERRTPKHARVEKLENRPQLAQVVFYRRAGHGQPLLGRQQPTGLGRLRVGVFDGLRFVQNAIVEFNVLEMTDVAPQRAIRGHDQVVIGELLALFCAAKPGVVQHSQLGRKATGLFDPIVDQAARRYHERRPCCTPFVAAVGAGGLQQRKHLHRFAQPHVVGQAAAKAEFVQKVQPAEARVAGSRATDLESFSARAPA